MKPCSFNIHELCAYFDARWNLEDRAGFSKSLRYLEKFEAELPEFFLDGVHKIGTHPTGHEIWLWDGKLLSTKVNPHAVCEHCHGRRMLRQYGEWRSFWYCLDCNKEIFPVDAKTFSPNPGFD